MTSASTGSTSPPCCRPSTDRRTGTTSSTTAGWMRRAAGRTGSTRSAAAARDAGMGVLVDIVPNHMGVGDPAANAWWWDVLASGRDVGVRGLLRHRLGCGRGQGAHPGAGESIERPRHPEPCASSATSSVPRAPVPAAAVGRRRPADVVHASSTTSSSTGVARLRAELPPVLRGVELAAPGRAPEVFEASHREIVRWVREAGRRVRSDCASTTRTGSPIPAGTSTPGRRDRRRLRAGREDPPVRRAASAGLGDRGHHGLRRARRHRPRARRPGRARALEALDASLRPEGPLAWADLIHDTRRAVADGILQLGGAAPRARALGAATRPDARRCARRAPRLLPRLPHLPPARRRAPRGCARGRRDRPAPRPRRHRSTSSRAALGDPRASGGDPLPADQRDGDGEGRRGHAPSTGTRGSPRLTEVGGDPDQFAHDGRRVPCGAGRRLAAHPAGMTTLTTHDTKRGEDTRARISVLAELPGEWAAFVGRRRRPRSATARSRTCSGSRIVGSWPREREALHEYADKAAREAEAARAGQDPDEAFEDRAAGAGRHGLRRPATAADLERVRRAHHSRPAGRTRWREAAAADRPRCPGRLPGQRALGVLARRPRQPAPRRLRRAPPDAGRARRGSIARRSTRRARPSCSSHPAPCVPPRPAGAVHRLHPADRVRACGRPPHRSRPRRRDPRGDPAAGRAGGGRRLARHDDRAAERPVPRRPHRRAVPRRRHLRPPTCSPATPSHCCSGTDREPNIG